MAIAHCSIRNGKPGKGFAHALYVQGEGRYANRDDVVFVEHGNMPSFAEKDPAMFWEAADQYERANGRPYREIQFAIPRELETRKEQQKFVDSFVFPIVGLRLPYTLAIHDSRASDGGRNIHAHLMFSERALDGIERDADVFFRRANSKNPHLGGAKKDRALNARSFVTDVRSRYGDYVNTFLQRVGSTERISMARNERSQPEPKLGPAHPRAGKDPRREDRLAEVQALRQARKGLTEDQAAINDLGQQIRAVYAAQQPPGAGRSYAPRRDPEKRAQSRLQRTDARVQMRRKYQAWLVEGQGLAPQQRQAALSASSRQQFRALSEQHRAVRSEIRRCHRPGPERKALESLAALNSVAQRERLTIELASARKADQAAEAEQYRAWVAEQAQAGDPAAISQLRGWAYADKRRAKAIAQAEAERSQQDGITAPTAKLEYPPDSPTSLKRRVLEDFEQQGPTLTPAAAKLDVMARAVLHRMQHRVDLRSGDVVYLLDKRDVFTDTGKRLAFTAAGAADRAAVAAALGMARVKFGRTITLTGSDAFKEQAIEIMVEKRMDLQLADPVLEARRQALVEERRQRLGRRPAVFSQQPQPPATPAPSRSMRPAAPAVSSTHAAKTPHESQALLQSAMAARRKMRQLAQPSTEPVQAAPKPTQDALRVQDLADIRAELAKRGITDLRVAEPGQRYDGRILVVTTYHVVQNAGRDRAIVHDRQAVPGGLVVGRMVTLGQSVRSGAKVPAGKPRPPRR